jgi:phosphomevalonate kinase
VSASGGVDVTQSGVRSVGDADDAPTTTSSEPNLYLLSPIKLAARALAVLEPAHFKAAVRAAAAAGLHLQVTLQADNDFYSQREELLARGLPLSAASQLPNFLPYRGAKTGLGSSAALVSSLSGAVLETFADALGAFADLSGPVAASPGKTLALVVAQLAHAEAQHSIGSGFDIASAVVGSCRYVRFSPSRLAGVFGGGGDDGQPALTDDAFRALLVDQWDHRVEEFSLPPRFDLLMGDVSAGSVTTSMSSRVLKWLAEGGDDARGLWERVARANERVEAAFAAVTAVAGEEDDAYHAVLDALARVPAAEWSVASAALGPAAAAAAAERVVTALVELRDALRTVRSLMRAMGEVGAVE